ncbi:MAG TPA: hypothetical protein VGT78_06230 [Rhizomicrobium sp.]|nr:hypothetical protein [Rhizomicrobium sp.]
MQFAKDKRSGVELPAKTAIAGRIYACPVCGEDVYVKGGFIYVRHFAHRSGRADRECENYHGGSAIAHPLTPPSSGQSVFGDEHGIRIDPLKLGFRVEAATSVARGDRRRWRLVLTLPKSPTGIGRLRVPTGFGTQSREVRLFVLSQAAQDIDVNPNTTRFGPEWVSDEVDHAYRESVSDRLDGLVPDSGHAFDASAAKVKPPANNFDWGDSYYIIWKRPDVIIPDALNALHLAGHEGWSAALITLPPEPVDEVAVWLRHLFSLSLRETKRRWGILYPPPIDIDLDDNISVSDAANILLGFFGSCGRCRGGIKTIRGDDRVTAAMLDHGWREHPSSCCPRCARFSRFSASAMGCERLAWHQGSNKGGYSGLAAKGEAAGS